jgi:hypothetical protein
MNNPLVEVDFDFGFSSVSEEEFQEREAQAAIAASAPHKAQAADAQARLDAVVKMVMPLLNNLAKDDKKEYIYWPDRTSRMKEFITKFKVAAGV